MSTIVERFLTDEFKITRPGPGKYVKGRYQPGEPETLLVYGSLQPLGPRELKLLTEGDRFKQVYRFYTDQPLLSQDSTNLSNSERLTINGDRYRVISVESWVKFDLEYHKNIVAREPEQETDAP